MRDLDRLDKLAELLALGFYGLMLIALAVLLSGATGWGFVFLALGAGAHVGRAGIEDFVDLQRARAVRARAAAQRRPRQPRTRPRPSGRTAPEIVVRDTRQRRVRLG